MMHSTNQQNGHVEWTGNQQLPVLTGHPSIWAANGQCQSEFQRIAFMRECNEIFINLNENLTQIGIILLNKLPAGVHVVVAPQPQRISAVKLPFRYYIANHVHIGFTSGERSWPSSL